MEYFKLGKFKVIEYTRIRRDWPFFWRKVEEDMSWVSEYGIVWRDRLTGERAGLDTCHWLEECWRAHETRQALGAASVGSRSSGAA